MPEFKPVITASEIPGSFGFRYDGEFEDDYVGRFVSGCGDANGDGRADLLLGAPYNHEPVVESGFAYVVFGGGQPLPTQSLTAVLAAGGAYKFEGEAAFDKVGYALNGAGDIDGDGIDDLLLGARSAVAADGTDPGTVYLLFGGLTHFEALDRADGVNDNLVALENLTAAHGYRIDGAAEGDQAGYSVSGLGDMNGDGENDFILSSNKADPVSGAANGNEGSGTIVFGGLANLRAIDAADGAADGLIHLAQLPAGRGLRLDGSAAFPQELTGYSVAGAGDVNGDGYDDALIGSLNADSGDVDNDTGAAFMIFGKPAAAFTRASLSLGALAAGSGVRFDGLIANSRTGHAVNTAGDINGDGLADILIGAPSTNNGGVTYVVFGKTTWGASFDLASLDGANGFRLDGSTSNDLSGVSLASTGDVNGDGYADILVAAQGYDNGGIAEAGAAYVVFGKAAGFAASYDLSLLDGDNGFRIQGDVVEGILGRGQVGPAGDVNGDGFDDIAVGVTRGHSGGDDSGEVYVVYGHRADSAVTREGTGLSNRINGGRGGDTISGLGGNDTLFGWESADTIDGGEGNDRIDGGGGSDTVDWSTARSAIVFTLSASGGGATAMITTVGRDTIAGIENIIGGLAGDVIGGNAGINRLDGRGGNDLLRGYDGADTLEGGAGLDRIDGGEGNDVLAGGGDADLATGGGGADRIQGGLGDDTLHGETGRDVISGDEGQDILKGGDGFDSLDGGAGNDRVIGGADGDVLTGGAGADRFYFDPGSGSDTVTDFTNDQDTLVIDPGFGFAGAADVVAATIQVGPHARIILGGGDQIYLWNYLGSGNAIASLLNDIMIA